MWDLSANLISRIDHVEYGEIQERKLLNDSP
jgi:hypothetical protein